MSDAVELLVPLCFTVDYVENCIKRYVTVGGSLRFTPRRCEVAPRPAVVVRQRDREQTYYVHDGELWKKAVFDRDVVSTRLGIGLMSEAFGIPFVDPQYADFEFTRPPPAAAKIPVWREELDHITRMFNDDVVACDDDFYLKCDSLKIQVRWPRQTTSKPTLHVEESSDESQETTCFSMRRLADAERFIATHRAVPSRFPVRVDILPAFDGVLDDGDDVAAFAAGTKAWLTDKLDDPDPITALLRHGYGLLPVAVIEDLEEIRASSNTGTENVLDAVRRIREVLSGDGLGRQCDLLAAAGVCSDAVAQVRHLGRRIARMTRLAVLRWEFERPQRSLASVDADALDTLADAL